MKDPCGTSAYRETPVKQEKEAKPQREKKPQIEGADIKDCRHPGTAAVRPGLNSGNDTRTTRRPTTTKRQIQPSHSVVKMAWEKNEEHCGNLDEEVAVAEQVRRDSEKVQDEVPSLLAR